MMKGDAGERMEFARGGTTVGPSVSDLDRAYDDGMEDLANKLLGVMDSLMDEEGMVYYEDVVEFLEAELGYEAEDVDVASFVEETSKLYSEVNT